MFLLFAVLTTVTLWSFFDSSPFYGCKPLSELQNEPIGHDVIPPDAKCYRIARGKINFESNPILNETIAISGVILTCILIVAYAISRIIFARQRAYKK
jgi:hypothetical protein